MASSKFSVTLQSYIESLHLPFQNNMSSYSPTYYLRTVLVINTYKNWINHCSHINLFNLYLYPYPSPQILYEF